MAQRLEPITDATISRKIMPNSFLTPMRVELLGSKLWRTGVQLELILVGTVTLVAEAIDRFALV